MPVILRCHPDLNNLERQNPPQKIRTILWQVLLLTWQLPSLFSPEAPSSLYQPWQVPIKLAVSKRFGGGEKKERWNHFQQLLMEDLLPVCGLGQGAGERKRNQGARSKKGKSCTFLFSLLISDPPVYLFIHFNLLVAPNDPKQIVGQPGLVSLFHMIRTFIHTFNILSSSWMSETFRKCLLCLLE